MTPSASDRNLLFGILALQLDFISRDALIQDMHAWVLNKSQALGAILHQQGALGSDRLALLDALVSEHLKQHGQDVEQSLAAVSSINSVREELAQIADADLQASLAHVSRAAVASADGRQLDATVSVGTSTAKGSRFRILRPHAQGGLGEVFLAHDEELHRTVALKQMQERLAPDAQLRSRFLVEAEITGGLEHPGIVPVYGLGSDADGRPFYAMRFIQGDNLKEAITQFHRPCALRGTEAGGEGTPPTGFHSLAFRQLLGRFIDVCNAIAYAHSRGVLHRDLKPGNVMLGKFGETLVVDWGLAKVVGRSESERPGDDAATLRPASGSGVAATVAGSAIGTPAYMSPEQAAGKLDLLGPATDVYSLGATLFTLLTNRAPVSGSDRAEILRKVQRGDAGFATPVASAVRVPPALLAVCKKAMALRPTERYATPLALAGDLEHWLADEPVSAATEPMLVRGRRWLRKHPATVSGLAAAVLVAVAGLTVGAILLGEKNQELSHVNQSLTKANAQLDLKQARLACDSPLSIHVTFDLDDSCGELRTYVVVHLKPASEIAGGFPMSAATQDLRRPSHKGRLFKD
jgi:serine/threonine-protein kinase